MCLYLNGLQDFVARVQENSGLSKTEFVRRIGCEPDTYNAYLRGTLEDGHGIQVQLGSSSEPFNLTIQIPVRAPQDDAEDLFSGAQLSPQMDFKDKAFRRMNELGLLDSYRLASRVMQLIDDEFSGDRSESQQGSRSFRKKGASLSLDDGQLREWVSQAKKSL